MQPPSGKQGDSCGKCGAHLAADQRYCIECGERRGDPRLPLMDGRDVPQQPPAPAAPTQAAAGYYPPPAAPPKGKWSSGLALLSTIAVLLLAMGVGVLIGSKGGSSNASQPVILGGGATAPAGASEASASTGNEAAEAANASGETKSGIDASAIAKKNGVKLAKPDVDLGDKCEKGSVGCNDKGEFDGEYFK